MASLLRSGIAVAAMALAGTGAARADDEDLVRGIIGIGSAIFLNQMQQDQQRRAPSQHSSQPPHRTTSSGSSKEETRALRAEIQRRLNVLGFDAGYPDGIFGPRTRRAIAKYQASIGHNADGQISRDEIATLYQATGGTMPDQTVTAYDGGSAGTFPKLGGGGNADSAGTAGAFPTLGGGGNTTSAGQAGQFPAIGGGKAAKTGPATDFPQIGSPAAADAGAAFPALGSASATDGGPAMPALGKPGEAASSDGGGFPGLGRPPEAATDGAPVLPAVASAPEQAVPAFPATAQPSAAEPVAMPVLGETPPQPAAAMPAVANAPERSTAMPTVAKPKEAADDQARETIAALTFEGELAKTVFATHDVQPDIGGVMLGQEREATLAALATAGFAGCADTQPVECRRSTDTLDDAITVWSSEGGNWAIRRVITFKAPAPADFVMKQFESGYPDLFAAPRRTVSSGEACHTSYMTDADLAAVLGLLARASAPDRPMPDGLAEFAMTCPLVYMISFQGADRIASASLTFFDATRFTRIAAAQREEAAEKEKATREKLSNDLKL